MDGSNSSIFLVVWSEEEEEEEEGKGGAEGEGKGSISSSNGSSSLVILAAIPDWIFPDTLIPTSNNLSSS